MNIPPVSTRSHFNMLVETDNLHDENATNSGDSSGVKCNDSELNLIYRLTNENYVEEEEEQIEENDIDAIIEEYDKKIRNMTAQNNESSKLCNIDFEKADISEIENEIEKTKETIKANEEIYQRKIQEMQKMRDENEKVALLRNKAIALYNEMVSWSQNMLKTKYPNVQAQTQLPHPKDVYQNSSKDPNSISVQILAYYTDIKKQIKRK